MTSAPSRRWPRLHAEILGAMPATINEKVASGQVIAAVRQRYASDPPSRHTIQRALEHLEDEGILAKQGTSRDRTWWRTGKPAGSEFARRPPLDLAIALLTLRRHAANHLPAHVLEELESYFVGAERVLSESPMDPALVDARAWISKTARIEAGYPLVSPRVNEGILHALRKALYLTKLLRITYLNSQRNTQSPASFTVVPLGLVERGPVLYLVASRERSDGSFKVYQLRLDRFSSAVCLETPGTPYPGFDLNQYVRSKQSFSFLPEGEIQLKLRVREEESYRHLFREQWLSSDQIITEEPGGFQLEATVMKSVALRNLLLERCARVEVLSPPELREEIAGNIRLAHSFYEA